MSTEIVGYSYYVKEEGREHLISMEKNCLFCCQEECDGWSYVEEYLREGGKVVPLPLLSEDAAFAHDMKLLKFQTIPDRCPICGYGVEVDSRMNHKTYGKGWKCKVHGYAHLYEHRYSHLREMFDGTEWLYREVETS